MMSSPLENAMAQFVAAAKSEGTSGTDAPLAYRQFDSAKDLQAASSRYPGERRYVVPDEATKGFWSEQCSLNLGGLQFVYNHYRDPCGLELSFDAGHLGIHYVERGSAIGFLGRQEVSRGESGDFMFAINRSPVVRIEYTEDFSMLSVFVPIPEGQRFSFGSDRRVPKELRSFIDYGAVVVGHAPLWEAHLSYALDYGLRSAASPAASAAADRVLGEYLFLLFCHEIAIRSAHRDANDAHVMVPTRLRVAEQYVSTNVVQAPSVDQVAAAAGISARSLHGLFTKFRGVSPSEFIRDQRLRGIRKALRCAADGSTVGDIAAAWGYENFGNFAATYKKRFGELPSETLGRRELAGTEG
jgi:AraC-like DNA-binding protein